MTNDDSQQGGGPEWERNTAAKKIAAGLSAGDDAVIEQGASDLGDAVVNTVISKAFKSLERTLDIALNSHIGPIAKNQVDLGSKQNELKHEVIRRLDASNDAHERTHTAVQELARGVGKLNTQVEEMGEVQAAHSSAISDLTEVQNETSTKVDGVIARVDSLEDKVESVIVTQEQHGRTLAQHSELLERINRQYTDLSVLIVHMDFMDDERPQPPELAALIRRLRDATAE